MRKAAAKSRWAPRIAGSYRAAAALAIAVASLVFSVGSVRPTLLDDIRRAIFDDGDPDRLAAARVEGTIEMGGAVVGRVVTLAARSPRAMREVAEISGTRQITTILADSTWIEDANGMVRAASGDERASFLLAHCLFFHEYLRGSSPEFEVTTTEEGLEIRPRDGLPRRLQVDPGGVPSALVQSQLGVDVVTRFSDWRDVGGVRFPFVTVQSTGDPAFDVTVRTTSVELLDRLPAGAVTPPDRAAATDFAITDPDSALAIPFESVSNLVFVRVRVDGGEPAAFLLDTGAGATVVAAEYAKRAGLSSRGRVEARGAGGSEAAAFVELGSLTLPGVELRDQTVVSIPLDGIASALGTPVEGILGYDFLSRCAVEIDYPARRLAIRERGGYEPAADAVRIPLRLEANVPRVDGVLDGEHSGPFLLDTGNSQSLLLHSPFVRAAGLEELATDDGGAVAGIGGEERIRAARIDSFAMGGATFRDVPAMLATSDSGIAATGEALGNVGGGLFANGVLAFDYSEGSLWISETASSASRR